MHTLKSQKWLHLCIIDYHARSFYWACICQVFTETTEPCMKPAIEWNGHVGGNMYDQSTWNWQQLFNDTN